MHYAFASGHLGCFLLGIVNNAAVNPGRCVEYGVTHCTWSTTVSSTMWQWTRDATVNTGCCSEDGMPPWTWMPQGTRVWRCHFNLVTSVLLDRIMMAWEYFQPFWNIYSVFHRNCTICQPLCQPTHNCLSPAQFLLFPIFCSQHPTAMKWGLTVALICIPLVVSNVFRFPCWKSIIFLEKCIFAHLQIGLLGALFLLNCG